MILYFGFLVFREGLFRRFNIIERVLGVKMKCFGFSILVDVGRFLGRLDSEMGKYGRRRGGDRVWVLGVCRGWSLCLCVFEC